MDNNHNVLITDNAINIMEPKCTLVNQQMDW